mmetsp:Transcript_25788/g.40464  ORF Transcript_25788/g.40464 Transcript_25788/m.40464 type:complete len:999 (+) Transcript_25788:44-3040(+)|eukprot:CAMPEP_0201732076 /NCGR_PEP_ID=MMETSP0593-20130828/27858_1 /ASSEMBLY_ACC=CAM_ASM_000672 /TAXON_ID=267983 /ORGANISM="Skeletonema japonicum, Strain CCMP2506" /LENGTH=998 /DNA_ID=CAMNT_0048224987 /DNA_START=32 /DNA_END=3028 /DNA_ORIENTATION=-
MTEVSSPPSAAATSLNSQNNAGAGRGRRRGKRGGGRGNGGGAASKNKNELTNGEAKVVDDDTTANGQSTKSRSRRGRKGGRANNASQSTAAVAAAAATEIKSDDNANGGDCEKRALPDAPSSPRTEQAMQFIAESLVDSNNTKSDGKSKPNDRTGVDNNKQSKQRNRKARGKKKIATTTDDSNKDVANVVTTNSCTPEEKKKKKRRNRNRKPKQKEQKSYPWKKFIPDGAEDPISLDPLEELPYPPFALVVDEPYVPIYPGMWPPQDGENNKIDDTAAAAANVVEDSDGANNNRELQILKEQWGDNVAPVQKQNGPGNTKIETDSSSTNNNIEGRRFNLFDGRALANYVVSELQFIDPFNRRDLTRGELQALDAYLAVHKLGAAGVVEAYDDNGTTISTAGARAQTPGGRALMLQQRAQAIRDSLYQSGGSTQRQHQSGGGGTQDMRRVQTWQGSTMGDDADIGGVTNQFQRMYAAHERGQRGAGGSNNNALSTFQTSFQPDTGIYDEGGLLMIDDDINPGLRSQIVDSTRTGNVQRISHEAQARDNTFPSLQNNATAEVAAPAPATNVSMKKAPKVDGHSKGLSKIGKMVKQSNPKQLERQRKAREEANRRAELSRQMFFDPSRPETATTGGGLLTAPAKTQQNSPSEAVLERNRNLAFALGVAPSTVRNESSLTGWARPTTVDIEVDEFGNELNTAQYPDALLAEAKERMSELVKLEKQWKKFLADDKEASCSLKAMLKPLRKFVHEYSDFWRLHTESFDPEGRRYIYCKKLADTAAPYPLLSEAARKWRGPAPGSSPAAAILNTSQPSSAVGPVSSDGWRVEGRVPLKLAPRTVDEGAKPEPVVTGMGVTRSSSTPFLSMTGEKPPPPRFANLHENERPRLQLAKRQIPPPDELERRNLSPEQWEELDNNMQEQILREIDEQNEKKRLALEREQRKVDARIQRKEHKAKKKQDFQQKKQALLASAFASDDDDDDDSDNDWFESDIAFDGSDDEGR